MKNQIKNLSNGKQSEKEDNVKKPFNKKKYRIQKYSNEYKSTFPNYASNVIYRLSFLKVIKYYFLIILFLTVNQWEERRKKAILRNFYKELNKDQQQNLKKPLPLKSNDQEENAEEFVH